MSSLGIYVGAISRCSRSARWLAVAVPLAVLVACGNQAAGGEEAAFEEEGHALSSCPPLSSPQACTASDPCRDDNKRCDGSYDRHDRDTDNRDRDRGWGDDRNRDDNRDRGWGGDRDWDDRAKCPPVSALRACTARNPCRYNLDRCDYSHVDLTGFANTGNMERTNFSGANLTGARLTGNTGQTRFVGADLTNAILAKNADRADLTNATVTCAGFDGNTKHVTCPGLIIGTKGTPAVACLPKGLPSACLSNVTVNCPAPAACQKNGVASTRTRWVCTYANANDGTGCDDGNACTQADVCQSGTCTGTNPVTCTASDQCHVAGKCDPASGQCSNPAAPATSSCDDGLISTYADHCDGAGTCGGTPVACPSDTSCTRYVPNGTASCTAIQENPETSCDDGLLSTYADHCDGAGSCSGAPVVCPANTQCMTYSPNGTSTCTATPALPGASCDDGNLSSYADHCDGAGSCVGAPVTCPANAQCTSYVPNGTSTCSSIHASPATSCSDGDLSTYSDHCDGAGHCMGTPVTCPANTQCMTYSPNGTSACTSAPVPNGTTCDDNSLSTYADACDGAGSCLGTQVVCPADTQCTTYAPNGTATCTVNHGSPATSCDDGDLATYADHCDGAGGCTGASVICPSDTQCTSYVLDGTSTCAAVHAGPTTSCDDGQLSTYADRCDGTGGCDGTAVVCPADTQCATYSPNGTATCAATFVPNGTTCDNGYVCEATASCQSGTCVGTRGLLSSWRADGNPLDSAGPNNGTLVGSAQLGSGLYGQSFQLSPGGIVDVGTNAGNFGLDDFTIEFWVQTTQSKVQAIMSKRSSCGNDVNWWDIRMTSEGWPVLESQDSVSYVVLMSNRSVADGVWHHVVFVRQANTLSAYIDGYFVTSSPMTSKNNGNSGKKVLFGFSPCINSDGTLPFRGSLDEVSFYKRALTPNEIAAQAIGMCVGAPP